MSADSQRGKEVIRCVMDMARRLHMVVIAEDVGARGQVEFLKQNRCDIVQGYYYPKTLPNIQFGTRLLHAELKGGIANAAAKY